MPIALKAEAPPFDLAGVDGKRYTLDSFRTVRLLAVIFSCNHCPYVQAYEERMIAIQRDYGPKGVQLVLINSNDDVKYPEDSFPEMAKRARQKGYPFPYLRDESQETARAYQAERTPHIFLFDEQRRLRYTGRIDDNWQDPKAVKSHDLREALDALLQGREPPSNTPAIGCTIKWK